MDVSPAPIPTSEQRQSYLLLRVLTGLDFFGHGFARIFTGSHLSGFAQGMVKNMASTPLPPSLALASGYVIPCVELLIGILLLSSLLVIVVNICVDLAYSWLDPRIAAR